MGKVTKNKTLGSKSKSLTKSKAIKKAQTPKKTASSKFTKTIEVYADQKDLFKMDKELRGYGFATRSIHAGCNPDPVHGAVQPAIELSTTFAQPTPGVPSSCFDYSRCGNPTVMALQRNLASMEGGKYAFATNNGCAATVSIMSLLQQGDHLLCIDDVYGGTQRFLRRIFTQHTGISWDMTDFSDMNVVRKAFKKNTKIVWIETPTNPTLKCTDIAAVAKICKEKNAILIVDSTFMSPALTNPLSLGADIVYHSITKYIGGHSDVLGGAIVLNDSDLYDKLSLHIKTIGANMNAFEAFIALRGCKTLKLRAEKAAENALAIAKWLEKHDMIEKVIYPGLKSHPHYKIAQKQKAAPHLNGGSGMLSFYVRGDIKKTKKFLSSLKVITLAESLGGIESLIECPAIMTHGSVPPAHRKMLGIDDNFVRLSTGIEEVEDLIADLQQAFEKI